MDIIEAGKALIEEDLTFGTGGNLSERTKEGFRITPSGLAYEKMEEKDLVTMNEEGEVLKGIHRPSSEWELHRQIYLHEKRAMAVIHTHSKYVNVLACTGRKLPAIHYLLACVEGDSVDIAPYHTYGTKELAEEALSSLHGKKAVILANHGLVTWGETIKEAFDIARTVEFCSFLYVEGLKIGNPVILSKEEMAKMVEKFKDYGPGKEIRKK